MPIQRIHQIRKNDLLQLLSKSKFEILGDLNRSEFGLMVYLEKRRYAEGDEEKEILEMVLEILSLACSVSNTHVARLDRILKMLKNSQEFLFDDIPRVLHSCIAEKQGIDLGRFIFNYMKILRTLLRKEFFPHKKILNQIFPTLENYMNRLHEQKIANLDKAIECFRRLREVVERYEDPTNLNKDEDDSEMANFRLLSVVPKSNDIVNYEVSSVPQNIVNAPYKSVDHFLSVHYRLTREDMLRSFRECVRNYILTKDKHNNFESTDCIFFDNVSVGYPPKYSLSGIYYDVMVSTRKEVNWSKKGLLMSGSLVFFTPDLCNSVVFAKITKNPKADFGLSKTCRLKIKLEDDLFQDVLSKDTQYTMIQPSAYFECYKHVLSSIKEFTESNFPLSEIITYLNYDDPEPEYLQGKKYCLHEKCDKTAEPEISCSCKEFDPMKDNDWPTSNDLDLDDQQYAAFKVAMTKKVAIIQGPPGTGKTHIGVKIVKALLRNVDRKPIVICCLTNHALDQFLERMLDFTKKIVRLGSQSKSDVLKSNELENMIYSIDNFKRNPSINITNVEKKSFNLVRKIAPIVLEDIPEIGKEAIYYDIKKLSSSINSELKAYSLCKEKYLDDSALNDIIDSKYKKQLRNVSGSIEKSLSAGLLEWLACSRSNDLYDKCRNKFYDIRKREVNPPCDIENIWTLVGKKRFELFYYWRKRCLDIREGDLEAKIKDYKTVMQKYNKDKELLNPLNTTKLEILKGADIVGVTTTGACKFKDLLRFASPHIIVIEEAAQVLESHVVASLVPSIQHLILIGDHEQLRPLPADIELSEKYNLKVSMFERLFRNKAPSTTLVKQHRMKPCIAELLVPIPYKEYTSNENVYKYEEIKGVESSVFFFNHCTLEDENSTGTSMSNAFEAHMVVNFAKYLNFIHYSANQITVISTYARQVNLIHDYLLEQNLDGIKVTTVDNFQGEENDIILISFVRSNPSAVIGFLKESNRVCVALSRARMGMFCFGNFEMFADKNDLWNDIVEKLRVKNQIGDTLFLKCPKHNNTVHSVKCAKDILEFLNRGCSEKCNFILPCNHICSRKCHFKNSDHLQYLCKQPCDKMIDETRVCPRLCYERCKKVKRNLVELPCGHMSSKADSKCFEEVQIFLPCDHLVTVPCHIDIELYQCKALESIILDCGHKKQVYCFQQQENMKVTCTDRRQETAPCGHIVIVPCGMHFDENDLSSFCDKACGVLLNCKHPCLQFCRSCFDTGIHGFCTEKCDLVLTCGHKCEGFCGSPCPPCIKKCFISCAHRTFCINDCLRPCVTCLKPCERKCKHKKCSKLCWEDCNIDQCTEQCVEILPCGHQCIGFCGDTCPSLCRICHAKDLEKNDSVNCFYVQLECEHVIEVVYLYEHISNCLLSLEWPSCPECSLCITKSTRFKKELKQAKQICIDSWDTSEEISKVLYLVECMYGKDCIVPAQFLAIHKKIVRILRIETPKSHELMVLKTCVMLLKKLVIIASKFNEYNEDECVQGKFETLLKWIYNHLIQASFQQLTELETSVKQLRSNVMI